MTFASQNKLASNWLAQQPAVPTATAVAGLTPVLNKVMDDSATNDGDLLTTAKVFKAIADMARDPEVRQAFTQTDAAKASCMLLERTIVKLGESGESDRAERVLLLVQLLRCICNISADNDECRAQILALGGIKQLAKVVRNVGEVWTQPLPVGQAAFGAILNVSLGNSDCTKALVATGTLADHLKALQPDASHDVHALWLIVCMSIDNMCEDEKAKGQFEDNPDLALTILYILSMLTQNELDSSEAKRVQRTLLWILCETLEKSAKVRVQLGTPESVLPLFGVLEYYLAQAETPDEDEDDDDDDDDDNSEKEDQPQPPSKPIPQANRYADAVTQAIVGISGEDDVLEALFGSSSLITRLFTILATERGTADNESTKRLDAMAAAAALCLGNLARTDAHCIKLVSKHPVLVEKLVHQWFSAEVNVRTRHAASGLLKNLCLPAANKQTMADLGLAKVAAKSIGTAVIPVQANAIGILRHLSTGEPAFSTILELVRGGKESALKELLQVVKQTDIDGIRCEGTRLLALVAKRAYLQDELQEAKDELDTERLDLATPL
ncbi:hypothetical protein EC988_002506, partial [Linderina pennispora]